MFNIIRDYGLLPYFLRYYCCKGVTRFICGLHQGQQNEHLIDIREKLRGYAYTIGCSYFEDFSGERDAVAQNRLLADVLAPGEWYLVADPDEFHYHAAFATFIEMRTAAEKEGADYVGSYLLDRLQNDGKLADLDLRFSLDEQFPLVARLTERILGGCCDKVVMARCGIAISPGHHFAEGKGASFTCETHHFKWQGSDFLERIHERRRSYKKQNLEYSIEPSRFLDYYELRGQRIDVQDPVLDVAPAVALGI